MRRVLVTGCGGFLGSHLCKALLDAGDDVVGADLVEMSPCIAVHGLRGRMPILRRDCSCTAHMLMTLRDERPTIVMHLGGMSHISASQADPEGAFTANVAGAFGVLEACRRYRDGGGTLDAIIVSSSNHTYGNLARRPEIEAFRERDALMPEDVYGATKSCADLLARAYAASYDLPIVALRHLNAFGEADPYASHIVTATMLALLKGERPVIRSDGNPVKGYLYVADLIAAYLAAAGIAQEHPGAYNVGSPTKARSVLALVEACIQAAGLDLVPDVRGEDLSQSGYLELLNDAAFGALTGWAPAVSLVDGLRRTFNWYKTHNGMAWVSTSGEGR